MTPRNTAGLLANPDEIRAEQASAVAVIFGVAYSALAITPSDAYLAPEVIRHALTRFAPYDARNELDLTDHRVVDVGDALVHDFPWQHAADAMHQHAATALGHGLFTIGLGGDHSVSWPLVTAFARQHGRVGIIQLDAHHDVRPYDEGVTNGCPIRGLVDDGTIDGRDVVQVPARPSKGFPGQSAVGSQPPTYPLRQHLLRSLRAEKERSQPPCPTALLAEAGTDTVVGDLVVGAVDQVGSGGAEGVALGAGIDLFDVEEGDPVVAKIQLQAEGVVLRPEGDPKRVGDGVLVVEFRQRLPGGVRHLFDAAPAGIGADPHSGPDQRRLPAAFSILGCRRLAQESFQTGKFPGRRAGRGQLAPEVGGASRQA